MRQIPQFEHLREIIQSDPSVLPQVIEQIAQSNPSLMEAIQNNQVVLFLTVENFLFEEKFY